MTVRAVVDCGLSQAAAAGRFDTTPKTAAKWIERFEAKGARGIAFRLDFGGHGLPSTPDRSRRSTLVQRAGHCIATGPRRGANVPMARPPVAGLRMTSHSAWLFSR